MSETVEKTRQARAKLAQDYKTGVITVTLAGQSSAFATFDTRRISGYPEALDPDSAAGRCVTLGAKEKIRDSYASPDTDVGEEVSNMIDNLTNGIWSERGERAPNIGDFAEAYASHFKIDVDAARAGILGILKGSDKAKLAKLKATEKSLEPAILAIRARKAAERAKKAQQDAKAKPLVVEAAF